jgi:hypothetical protein
MSSCSEYLMAARLVHQRANSEQNPHVREILQEIERSYHRLVEFEKWLGQHQKYNRPFAHFGLFNGR